MKEVDRNNFNQLYPEIETALKNANFIAIDSEFTGLVSDEKLKNSIFDSSEDRYCKAKKNIESYVIIQLGLTTFQYNADNIYNAETFCFSLIPISLPLRHSKFVWQIEALEFLTQNKFDFNKIIYHGLPYANKLEQESLQKLLQNDELFNVVHQNASYQDLDYVKEACTEVSDWLSKATSNLDRLELPTYSAIMQYLLHKELRRSFNSIWTISGNKFITVVKVKSDVRNTLEKEEYHLIDKALLQYYIGFSKIFELLTTLKKPIIGHNLFLDLLYMYQQFYNPLPKTCAKFKKSIIELFPKIYDTKHLSYELREILDKKEKWNVNSLGGLYNYFNDGLGKYLMMNTPMIQLTNRSNPEIERCHNAGWDSYLAGYAFIRIAHIFSIKKFGTGFERKALTTSEMLGGVKKFTNCINIMRGRISYMKLDGTDPEIKRPELLHVEILNPVMNIQQVEDKLSTFGSMDIQILTQHRALIAVSNYRSARDILNHFKNNKDISIVPHRTYRYSSTVKRLSVSCGLIFSGSILLTLILQQLQKMK